MTDVDELRDETTARTIGNIVHRYFGDKLLDEVAEGKKPDNRKEA